MIEKFEQDERNFDYNLRKLIKRTKRKIERKKISYTLQLYNRPAVSIDNFGIDEDYFG